MTGNDIREDQTFVSSNSYMWIRFVSSRSKRSKNRGFQAKLSAIPTSCKSLQMIYQLLVTVQPLVRCTTNRVDDSFTCWLIT